MNPAAATVFVVDDDPSALRSVTRLLRLSGFQVAPFESAGTFLAELPPDAPGCVVTDLRMPDVDGLALQEALARAGNPLPVIFLSGQGDIPSTVRAMRKGAEDFLTKTAPGNFLVEAIRRALARDERQREDARRISAARALLETLIPREREVLAGVLQGRLNKQIAADLGIHERTVKLYRTSLTRKLGVQSGAELARLVASASLPDFPFGQ